MWLAEYLEVGVRSRSVEVEDVAKRGTWLAEMSTVCAPASFTAVGHAENIRKQNGFDLDSLTYATNGSIVTYRPVNTQVGLLVSELRQMRHPHLLYSLQCEPMIEGAGMPGASWRERP